VRAVLTQMTEYLKKEITFFIYLDYRKLTKRHASGIKLWKFYFEIRACCALTSAFNKIAGTKKNGRQKLFLQATLFIKKK
jgi:hypothetical protein